MTDIEQRLVKAAREGEWLRCAEPDNVVPARLIRELLLGRHGELDPIGVRVHGARITGALNLVRVKALTGLTFSDCSIEEPVQARFARLPELHFHGGRCAGIHADGLHVDGDLFLSSGVVITGDGNRDTITLFGAHVAGDVELTGAEIINNSGTAVNADSLQIDGSLTLRQGVRITGHSETGAVNLAGARIGNFLEFTETTITNTAGPALNANRARIGGPLAMLGHTRFSAGGDSPALNLIGSQVGDSFGCADTVELEVAQESDLVLDLRDMTVESAVRLPQGSLCPDLGRGPTCEHKRLVRLDDFSYTSLASAWDWERWLHVIRCHTPAYHASAYQRLAAVERAAGHDGTVRRILMAQQTDLRRRSPQSLGGPLTRWFHWLWGALAGYGYRARRTAAALMLVLVVAGAIGWLAGQVPTRPGHLVAERVGNAAPCSTVELIGLGLDRGLPLAMTGMRARCDLDTASKKGQAFTAAIWLVQLTVWGLATLALAGYTNLVRKPG